eukprot:7385087-Prymnesium_polylepis.2
MTTHDTASRWAYALRATTTSSSGQNIAHNRRVRRAPPPRAAGRVDKERGAERGGAVVLVHVAEDVQPRLQRLHGAPRTLAALASVEDAVGRAVRHEHVTWGRRDPRVVRLEGAVVRGGVRARVGRAREAQPRHARRRPGRVQVLAGGGAPSGEAQRLGSRHRSCGEGAARRRWGGAEA